MKEKIKIVWGRMKNFAKTRKKATIVLILILVISGVFMIKAINSKNGETRYVLAVAKTDTISSVVAGGGVVAAESQVDIKPKVSGDVVYVGVKVGDKIKKGDLIAKIDDTDAQKSVRDAEISLENAKLNYEKAVKPATELELAQAKNALSKAEDNLDKETLAAYDAALSGLAKLPEAISGIRDLIYDTDFGFEMTNLNYYKSLVVLNRDGAKAAAALTDENYKKAESLYKSISSSLIAFDSDEVLDSLESVYAGVKAGLEAAQAERNLLMLVRDDFDNQDKDIPYFLITDLEKSEEYISALSNLISNLSSKKSAFRDAVLAVAEKEDDLEELKDKPDALTFSTAQISLSQRENSLADAKEKLNDHYIRAPFDGTVAKMNIKNADSVSSDSVSSGSSIATVVSEKSIAEISLNETDISKVKIGQKAVLDFDSTDDVVISGTIIEVDAVGSSSQGVVSYGAKIAFDAEDERIKSGMSVNAEIKVEERANVLVVPSSAVKSQGGRTFVSVVSDPPKMIGNAALSLSSLPAMVPVETGLENDDYVEIVSGLKEGDAVVVKTVAGDSGEATPTSVRTSTGGNMMMFQGSGMSAPRMR